MLVLALGCAPHADVDLALAVGEDVRSIVVGIERGDELEVIAADVDGSKTALEVLGRYIGRYEVGLTVIEYGVTLDALEIPAGPIARVVDGIALPSGRLRVMQTIVRGEAVDPWTEANALPTALENFRIAGEQPDNCVVQGGCFDRTQSDGTVCIMPCPEQDAPTPPTLPAVPDFGTCPAGWTERFVDGEIRVCTPYGSGFVPCPAGEAHFVDGAGCEPVGDTCPAGEWPEGLTGNVVYVRPGATGQAGTTTDPLGSIQAAIDAAATPATVALAKGTFDEDITLRSDVTIVGACTRDSIIMNSAAGATVDIGSGERTVIRNLQIQGRGEGINTNGALLTLSGVVITQTGSSGLRVRNGGRVDGDHVVVGPNVKRGMNVTARGVVTLDHVLVDRVEHLGVFARDPASRIVLTDAAIMNTIPAPSESLEFGRAVDVEAEGTVEITRGILYGAHDLSVFSSGGAQFLLRDGVIGETQPRPSDDNFGDAIHLLRGGRATLERVWVHETHRHHIYASAEDAAADLTDVVMSETEADNAAANGRALRIAREADVSMRRVVLSGSVRNMILLTEDAKVTGEDLWLRRAGIRPNVSNSAAGIRAEDASRVLLDRARFEAVSGKAISVYNTATASIADVTIEDVGGGTCHVCGGLCAHSGGRVTGARVSVEVAYGRGINASDIGSAIDLKDVVVGNGRAAPLCTSSTRSPLKGDGVGTVDGGRLSIERFVIEDNPGAGIVAEDYIAAENPMQGVDAKIGTVRRNTVGASLLIRDYELLRVADRVRYEENSSALNVP